MEINPLSTSNSNGTQTQQVANIRSKIPKAAILSFCLILILELFFFYLPDFVLDSPDFVNTWIQWKREEVLKPNVYQTLFLGECFGMMAFKPSVYDTIAQHTPSFNLCVYQRNTFLSQYYLLKKYLESAKIPPKQVILEFMEISLFDQTPLDENHILQHILPYLGRDADLMTEISRWTSTYRLISFPCWKRPMKGIFGRIRNWNAQKQAYQQVHQVFKTERGYYPLQDQGSPNLAVLTDLPDSVKTGTISEYNRYYLEKILDLLEQQKIEVILVVPCLRNDRRFLWNRYQIATYYGKYLNSLQQRYSNILATATQEFVNLFPNLDDFQDANHLRDASSDIFTRKLAEWVNRLSEKK